MQARARPLFELARHRTLAFRRQPEAVFWVFAFPLVLAAVLGWAFQSGEPAPSRIAVIGNPDEDPVSLRLAAAARLEVVGFEDRDAAERTLTAGKVDALLLDADSSPRALRLDPVRAEAEIARLRDLVALGELEESDAFDVEVVTERGSRYVDFLFPGLLGMNLMGTGLWAIGFAVADLRQRKVLKRLLVTPMRKSSFLASFLLSRLVFLALEVVILTAFAVWILRVPLRGDLFSFSALCLLGAVSFAGMGLLAASRVKTIEGASGMINLVMMPMWLGSGVFFSYERFPEAVHPILKALPLTAMNDALRMSMLEGAGLGSMGAELAILALWTVVPFFLALKLFRWA